MEKDYLLKFKTEMAAPCLREALIKTSLWFHAEKESLKTQYGSDIKKIFTATQNIQEQTGKEIAHITFTLLRVNFLYGKDIYEVFLYDDGWYVNDYQKAGEVDVSAFMKPLREAIAYLQKESKKMVGKINPSDIDNVYLQALTSFGVLFIKTLRYLLPDAVETDEYRAIKKADDFRISIGELYSIPFMLQREMKEKPLYRLLSESILSKEPCRHLDLKGSDFTGLDLSAGDFTYSDFRDSALASANLSNTRLDGAWFQGCKMTGADLSNAYVSEANFQHADLRQSNWFGAVSLEGIGEYEGWEAPGNLPMDMRGANMQAAVIENAVMIGVDFTQTVLDNASFKNTHLLNSQFTEAQAAQLAFTEAQRSQIIVL